MIIRAEGKMKSAAVMMGIGLLVNIAANYILIVLLNQGVVGAAWGTNIAMVVYTLLSIGYFRKGKATFEARPFSVRRDPLIIKSILSMGIPSFLIDVVITLWVFIIVKKEFKLLRKQKEPLKHGEKCMA